MLKAERPEQAIVFARTKIGADRLARRLNDAGVRVKALHGDMSQGSRDGVMIAFKGGRERLLIATDVAARGLDISGVTHVVNYDIPNSPDVYVHRIGRTGRVGRSGRAITLITPKQRSDLEAMSATPTRRSRSGRRTARPARTGAPARARDAPPPAHQAARAGGPAGQAGGRAPDAGRGSSPRTWSARSWTTRTSRARTSTTCGCSSASASPRCRRTRAGEVVDKVSGNDVRGVKLRLEVART